MTARSKAWDCGRSFACNVDSNPARGMDVYLLRVLCVVRSLRRADHLYLLWPGFQPGISGTGLVIAEVLEGSR